MQHNSESSPSSGQQPPSQQPFHGKRPYKGGVQNQNQQQASANVPSSAAPASGPHHQQQHHSRQGPGPAPAQSNANGNGVSSSSFNNYPRRNHHSQSPQTGSPSPVGAVRGPPAMGAIPNLTNSPAPASVPAAGAAQFSPNMYGYPLYQQQYPMFGQAAAAAAAASYYAPQQQPAFQPARSHASPIRISDPNTKQAIDLRPPSASKSSASPSPVASSARLTGASPSGSSAGSTPAPVTASSSATAVPAVASTPDNSRAQEIKLSLKAQIQARIAAEKEKAEKEKAQQAVEAAKEVKEAPKEAPKEAKEAQKEAAAPKEVPKVEAPKAEPPKTESPVKPAPENVQQENKQPIEKDVAKDSTDKLHAEQPSEKIEPSPQELAREHNVAEAIHEEVDRIEATGAETVEDEAGEDTEEADKSIDQEAHNAIALEQLKNASRPSPQEVNALQYPEGITAPAKNDNTTVYRYDTSFLLQFQPVVDFAPMEGWDTKKSIISLDRVAGKAGGQGGQSRPGSGAFGRQASSRSMGGGHGQTMGAFGSGSPGGFRGDMAGGRGGKMSRMSSNASLGASMGSRSGRGNSSRRPGRDGSFRRGDRGGKDEDEEPKQPEKKIEPEQIKRSANAWVPRIRPKAADAAAVAGEDGILPPEEVKRKVNSLLNKMTLENFDRITAQIVEISAQSKKEKDGQTLKQIIELTFLKACDESHWSRMYARFCGEMTKSVDPEIADETVNESHGVPVKGGALFRKYLLTKCQEEFERGWSDKLPTNEDGTPIDADLESEEYYRAVTAKRRGLGLIRFIGELFMLGLLAEKIIHACLRLLCQTDDPSEEVIESLCQLMTTVGGQLDRGPQGVKFLDYYFAKMAEIQATPGLPSRLKFMIMDVVDLRKSRWVNKDQDKGPKTLSEIHDEAAKRQRDEEIARAMRSGPRRGMSSSSRDHGPSRSASSSNMLSAGDLSKIGQVRSHSGHGLGPSNLMSREQSGSSAGSRKSSSSNVGIPLSGSRTPSLSSRINMYEHLTDDSHEEPKHE